MSPEPEWRGTVLFGGNRVLGWVGYELNREIWYGRTAGTKDLPFIRGEFDNEQSARDFAMFLASTQETT